MSNKLLKQVEDRNTDVKNSSITTDSIHNLLNGDAMVLVIKSLHWAIQLITILFVVGVIVMIFAIIFKHAQWQKFAQGTLLWTFITMIVLKAIPFIIFSVQNVSGVDQLFTTTLTAVQQTALYLGVIGICASLLFKFAYRLIRHLEFFKWQKTARNMSAIMILFSILGPFVFSLL